MPASVSISEHALLVSLRAYIVALTGYAQDHVVRGRVNGVPMPSAPFIVVQSLGLEPWRTNVDAWDATHNATLIDAGVQATFQVDCYGPAALDTALILSLALRDTYAQQFFPSGAASMYASSPKQLPFITAEEQYEERWSFDAVLAYNPVVSVPQDYFETIDIGLKPVDVYYPPSGS
jgi:hypothetical protein